MSKPIRIIRARHDNKYFSVSRKTAQDRNLSWEARGVLCYLLSKPDDWEVQPEDLEQGCSHNKVYKLLRELRDARYLKLIKVRDHKHRMTGFFYEVYETPYVEVVEDVPLTQNQQVEPFTEIQEVDPLTQNQQTGSGEKPFTQNRYITYNRKEQSTEKSSSSAELSDLDVQGYRKRYDYYHAFEAGFPVNAATKVNDTQSNQNHARDLFLAGYTLEEITALVKDKLAQGKADYRFHYLMADLAQARLERNPPAKKAPPGVINAGEKRIPHEWGINEFARQPAEEGDYD